MFWSPYQIFNGSRFEAHRNTLPVHNRADPEYTYTFTVFGLWLDTGAAEGNSFINWENMYTENIFSLISSVWLLI